MESVVIVETVSWQVCTASTAKYPEHWPGPTGGISVGNPYFFKLLMLQPTNIPRHRSFHLIILILIFAISFPAYHHFLPHFTPITTSEMPNQFAQKILNKLGVGEDHQGQGDAQRTGGPGPHHGGGGSDGPGHVAPCHIAEETHVLSPHGGTYPRLCRLSDGSVLCASTRFEGPTRVLHVTRSVDNGRSFEAWGEVSRADGDCDNLYVCEVGNGPEGPVVLGAFRNHDLGPDRKPSHFRITVCRSNDGGRTWHFLNQAVEHSAAQSNGMGLWEPFIRMGPHGQVELTYSAELAGDNQETFRVVSRDGGQTWSQPHCLTCHSPDERLRDGMQGIVLVQDANTGHGALVLVCETTRHGTFSVEYAISYDEGATWGHRGVVYCPPRGRNAGAPQIARFGNGALAVVFMTDEDAPESDWPKNASVKAVIASGLRGGRIDWSRPMQVSPHNSSWPGVLEVAPGQVMAAYEHGGKPVGKLLRLQ